MRRASLDLLACPLCHGRLGLSVDGGDEIRTGMLRCSECNLDYPIQGGIPRFIQPEELTGFNRRFARLYNWFSQFYRLFSKAAFAYIGMSEREGRGEILDRLELRGSPGSGPGRGGNVLEVSIGPGVNLPYLVGRTDIGGLYGLDISLGQLTSCQRFARRKGWEVELFLGNGEQLPFREASFDSVFHIGGINFFNDRQAAILEMIRVAKPGTRLLIADETEKGARGYERFIPGFKGSFGGKRAAILPPIDLVPPEMRETRLFDVWKGWLYCLEFRKP